MEQSAEAAGAERPGAEQLLGELERLRRRTRSGRHAYWLPLVLYGVLICVAAPLYVQLDDLAPRHGIHYVSGPAVQVPGLGGWADGYIAIYWLFALVALVAGLCAFPAQRPRRLAAR